MRLTKYAVFLTSFLLLAAAAPAVPNVAGILPVTAAAAEDAPQIVDQGAFNDSVTWQLDSAGTLTVTGSGDMSKLTGSLTSKARKMQKLVVQNTDAAHPLTAIGASLFKNCSELTEASLPDTVTVIGNSAFYGCTALSTCNFPSSLTEIGEGAFFKTALTSLELPGCTIEKSAFKECTALKTLVIEDGTEIIPAECFRWCTALESVVLPDSVKEIQCGYYPENSAFYNCKSLKTVSIGKSIEKIDKSSFYTNSGALEVTFREGVTAVPAESFLNRADVVKVNLPSTLKSIGKNAFYGCTALSVCEFPSSLTEIGDNAFFKTALTSLELPGCTIGKNAFKECTALKTVVIKDGTEIIPAECFRWCTALESVVLPDSVKEIQCGYYPENSAFYNCTSLKSVSIGKSIEKIDKSSFYTNSRALEVTFREGVTAIPAESFLNRADLIKVNLPSTLKSIGKNAFSGCAALSACEFPSSLTEIGESAFFKTALTSLELPGCAIGNSAFKECTALKTVVIGEGTEIIPAECFRWCSALESVVLPDSLKEIQCGHYQENSAFYNCITLKSVSIGKSIEKIDKSSFYTNSGALEVTFREGVTTIPVESFLDRTDVVKVNLPSTLTNIGRKAFSGCTNLNECNFPYALEQIGESAFFKTALTSLKLPGCALGESAFKECTALKTVIIGEGTETIPANCFRWCTALESVVLPDSVKEIKCGYYQEDAAFYNCPALKSVSIGKSIEHIDSSAFLTRGETLEVTFREGVKVLPDNALNRGSVTTVVLPESLETLGENALSGCSTLQRIVVQAPACEIAEAAKTIPASARICGYENSTAQRYAAQNGRTYEKLDDDDPVIAYGNCVTGASLTLDGRIGVNFYAKLNSKAVKVVLEGCDNTVEFSGDSLAAAKQADGSYKFTFRVNAVQAGEVITLKIYGADRKLLDIYNSDYERDSDRKIEFSVNDYIADAPKYQNNEKLNALVTALDQYCKAAENYFLKKDYQLDMKEVHIVKTNDFKKQFEIALVLNSGTALRIYSNASEAVQVKGTKAEALNAVEQDTATRYFEISDIAAGSLSENVTVRLDGTAYQISPMDYCALILAKNSDQKLRDVCTALYYYGTAAKAYETAAEQ